MPPAFLFGNSNTSERLFIIGFPVDTPDPSMLASRFHYILSGGILMQKFECGMCEYTYDPAKGDPARGIPPGTSFESLPDSWKCPKCGAGKNMFVEA